MARKKSRSVRSISLPESGLLHPDSWNPAVLNQEIPTMDTWNPAELNQELKRIDTWNPAEINDYLTDKYNLEVVRDANIENHIASFVTLEAAPIQEIDYALSEETGSASHNILQSSTAVAPENTDPYIYRTVPTDSDGRPFCFQKNLIGGSVVWNQLVDTNTESVTIPSGHKYILWNGSALSLATSDGSAVSVSSGNKFYDITQKFNTAVANVMTTTKFASLFPNYANYAYSAPTIQSTKVSGKKVVGFNQWDEEIRNGYYNATGEFIAYANNVSNKNPISVIPNTSYYLHIETSASGGFGRLCFYDKNGVFVSTLTINGNKNYLLTIPSNAFYLNFDLQAIYGKVYNNDICINISSAKNGTYEPYTTTTYDLSGSHLVKRKYALVDLGSLTWDKKDDSVESPYFRTVSALNPSYNYSADNSNTLCEKYMYASIGGTGSQSGMFIDSNGRVRIRDNSYSTAESFKTAMSGVYLLYELATPTTETVTNPTLYGIWKLDANNNLYFDGDSVEDIPNVQEIVTGGTQEYIDAAVADEDRDVSIPAGGEEYYYNNITTVTVPDPPETITEATIKIDSDGTVTITDTSGEEPVEYETTITMPDTLLGDNYMMVTPGEITGVKYTRVKPKNRRTNS